MLFKEAKEIVNNLGMMIRKRDGEYRVGWPGDEINAYYTNDLEDAVSTAKAMNSVKEARWI